MGIGTSIFLIATGAILNYAVEVRTEGVNLHTVGAILMIVGAVGVVLSFIFWSSWGGFHRDTVVREGPPVGRRRYIEEDF